MHRLYDRLTNEELVEFWLEHLHAAQPDDVADVPQQLAEVIDLQAFRKRAC